MYRLLNIDNSQPADMAWLMAQIVDEDVATLTNAINTAIKTRSPFYYQTRPKDPANPALFVDTHGEVDIGPDGRVVSIVGVCHDVTKQVIAENARAKAEERYRLMTEQASDIIMLHGADGSLIFASNALVGCVWRAGVRVVHGGRHVARSRVTKRYKEALGRIVN